MVLLGVDDVDALLDQGFDPHWLIGQKVAWHSDDELTTAVVINGSLYLQYETHCQGAHGAYDCPETTTVYLKGGMHRGAWCYAHDENGRYVANLRDQSYVCEQHDRERSERLAAARARVVGEADSMNNSTDRERLLVADALVSELLRERGDYVMALEQIRSSPHVGISWREHYQNCVKIASDVLDKNAGQRR